MGILSLLELLPIADKEKVELCELVLCFREQF
jgi:hypothetical protein